MASSCGSNKGHIHDENLELANLLVLSIHMPTLKFTPNSRKLDPGQLIATTKTIVDAIFKVVKLVSTDRKIELTKGS